MESFENKQQNTREATPKGMMDKINFTVNLFVKDFKTEGKDKLKSFVEQNPDSRFVITGSHFSNLDGPAMAKALGDVFNIQIAVAGDHFEKAASSTIYELMGIENFSPLEYKGGAGVFNPKNFDNLAKKMNAGKTPWLAIHPFTSKGKMLKARIGAVYLAHKTNSKIIPTGLEIHGNMLANVESVKEIGKAIVDRIKGKVSAVFHVGEPIELPELNVDIIERVLVKRSAHAEVTDEEKEDFKKVLAELRKEADEVAEKIAEMLPKEQRGVYEEKTK